MTNPTTPPDGFRSIEGRCDDELLAISEVALVIRRELNTLRYWRQLGKGPRFFKIGRGLFTTVADLKVWIQEQRDESQLGAQATGR